MAATRRSSRRCTDSPNCPTTSASGSSPTSSTRPSPASTSSPASRPGCARAAPELPDDPTPEQVDAWIELAELVQDAGFRATIRRMSEQQSASRQAGEAPAGHARRGRRSWPRRPAPQLAPASAEAQAIVAEILPAFGADVDRHRARRPPRGRHRRPRRALLAAAGDHQRLAAGPDHRARVGVVHRRAARLGISGVASSGRPRNASIATHAAWWASGPSRSVAPPSSSSRTVA